MNNETKLSFTHIGKSSTKFREFKYKEKELRARWTIIPSTSTVVNLARRTRRERCRDLGLTGKQLRRLEKKERRDERETKAYIQAVRQETRGLEKP